jgi:hypothetical protein
VENSAGVGEGGGETIKDHSIVVMHPPTPTQPPHLGASASLPVPPPPQPPALPRLSVSNLSNTGGGSTHTHTQAHPPTAIDAIPLAKKVRHQQQQLHELTQIVKEQLMQISSLTEALGAMVGVCLCVCECVCMCVV